jgi:hypothetical protein
MVRDSTQRLPRKSDGPAKIDRRHWLTPCSQSQIGQDRHLRRCEVAQVDATSVLSVVVRWRPVKTAVTGTLVARPRG